MNKPKRASGPTVAESERRDRGQALLAVRVSADLISQIDTACERYGLLRPALVRTALEDWLAAETASLRQQAGEIERVTATSRLEAATRSARRSKPAQ
jgi:hypothetical protein